ncbi:MAG: oligosaccharide flippase family protein [Candidatus Taylorbacteria bacterium]|nr:oligosaccharide flippase family protein [Candidatus Taylorbacteria bacterium]
MKVRLRLLEQALKIDLVYLIKGNFWLSAGRAIGIGSGILLTYAFANLLPAEKFGAYKYVLSIYTIISSFSLLGIGAVVINSAARGQDGILRPAIKKSLLWSIPGSLAALAIGAYYLIQGNFTLGISLFVVAVTNPLLNSLGNYKPFLQGKKDFRTAAIFGIPRTMIPVLSIIICLLFTESVVIIVSVYFLTNTLSTIFIYWLISRKYKIGEAPETDIRPSMSFARHSSLLGFISSVPSQIDQLLLWHFATPAQLALYAFAVAPVREMRNLAENLFPLITPKFAVRSYEEVKSNLPLRIKQLFLTITPLTAIYILLAPFIFKIFFPQYMEAVLFSQIFALSLLFQPRNLFEALLIAHERVKERYIATGISHAVRIALFVALIPTYSIIGAIASNLIADLLNFLILGRLITRGRGAVRTDQS